ncbi:pyruvate, phosphate dikinase [Thermoproteus tenax]|uniref:pyruvate, phosphate dikinase n=2 Tax=Thermoproteus tenax TaxID=2271 RepID=G4RP47_THETK|nr:pyruvate, phosphate dikinase [Thermoproteus tenax]CAD56493.1 pyruvate phosphate dikinase [Thermoproteus tenax Kra 1]CCC81342.1 Pyruvate, phosphate dikinase [Thermoproteus tenax Kra 1]
MPKKYVFDFDEADYRNKRLFGGKGASLVQMAQLGLRVPPGFIITTEACKDFFGPKREEIAELEAQLARQPPPDVRDALITKLFSIIDSLDLPQGLWEEVVEHMKRLEDRTGRRFGDPKNPLLVSVRSGAAVSMPGMMDTVLNLGLNDETVKGLAEQTNNEWFAYDAYRRFINMFGRIVLNIDDKLFSKAWDDIKRKYGVKEDPQMPIEGLKEAVEIFKKIVAESRGAFPQDPWEQLKLAIKAVFRSWDSPRAIFYRIAEKITSDIADCTAVNVVTMVFGNMGWDSGTGVVFSRDVATGENRLYGEFLPVAQGEDVVAGIRTPMDIDEFKKRFPHLYEELYNGVKLLEKVNKDVQDVEFTVERGRLYFLQCRNAKMTPMARVKTAVDMAKEGIITKDEALMKVSPEHVLQLLYPRIDPKANARPIAKGLPASPGAVSGQLVFNPDDAVKWARDGKKVVLARVETKPDDVHGFYAAVGILTTRGGMTSHAAVVARAIGKPAVVGAEDAVVDEQNKVLRAGGLILKEGDWVTIDGNTGLVYPGVVPTLEPELIPELEELLRWADEVRRLGVRANADLPEDAAIARKFGAEGIGLLRIERMFRKPERLDLLRRIILAENREERIKHLEQLYRMLKEDFKAIFEIMDGLPVVVRLIDPPLHEFLPKPEEVLQQICEGRMSGKDVSSLERLYNRLKALQEANPMLGHRGVRVGVSYPEVYYYLTKAIAEAASELKKEGRNPVVEIMIPQVSDVREIKYVKEKGIMPALRDVEESSGVKLDIKIGTMIETVRAALTVEKIAREVDFISFGTNDLTQAVFSFSRDDAENKFIPQYLDLKILDADPFETLDPEGVAKLVEQASRSAKEANPAIEVGVCGEHGGEPKSISLFSRMKIDYVSASPFRVPLARLAAAQAAIASSKRE